MVTGTLADCSSALLSLRPGNTVPHQDAEEGTIALRL